jgi:UDP-glucose 4-epimerase
MEESNERTARTVLITGASGLVGSRLSEVLSGERRAIERILALDLREPPSAERLPGVEYHTGDVRDPQLAKTLEREGVDTVVHLAAVVSPGPASTTELEYSIDVLGTENVLEACLRAGVGRLVYLSSGAAYGYWADSPVPLFEDDPLRGDEDFAYSHHKRLAEELLARARNEHPELAQLVFRPGTILGATAHNPITAMFDRPVVVGVIGSESPFVLIWDDDVARCIARGIHEGKEGVYNLCGDGAIPLGEMARLLGKPYLPLPAVLLEAILGGAHRLNLSARGAEQVRFLRYRPVLDNERLKTEFGFIPTYTSRECFEHWAAVRSSG